MLGGRIIMNLLKKSVSTFCPGHFSQELRNRLGIEKGTYWTWAWIYALLGPTSWKDPKTWWRCMSGTICWRSPEPAKCNTFPGCPFCFSFYLMMIQSVAPSFPGCAFYFSCKRLPMQSYWWHKVQHIDSYVNQGILVSCKVTFFGEHLVDYGQTFSKWVSWRKWWWWLPKKFWAGNCKLLLCKDIQKKIEFETARLLTQSLISLQ